MVSKQAYPGYVFETELRNILRYYSNTKFIVSPWGPFYQHGLTLLPAWMKNHTPSKV